jgi:hypothetical protein
MPYYSINSNLIFPFSSFPSPGFGIAVLAGICYAAHVNLKFCWAFLVAPLGV